MSFYGYFFFSFFRLVGDPGGMEGILLAVLNVFVNMS